MLNLPNSITLVRLVMVVVFTIALAVGGPITLPTSELTPDYQHPIAWLWQPLSTAACVALWAFLIGAVSDFFDGYLARRWKMVTNLGKLLDPLADKILVCAAFVYLSSIGLCPFWVTIVIIFREFLVTGLRQLAALKGEAMAADRSGKWKTGLQLGFCIACMVYLAYGSNLPAPLRYLTTGEGGEWCRGLFLWGSVILTLWSGAHYCCQAGRLLK